MLLLLTSTTQTERMYEVRVQGRFYQYYKAQTFNVRARSRSAAENEARAIMQSQIQTRVLSSREIKTR